VRGGGKMPITNYRVRYWLEDGSEDYIGTRTMESAQEFYYSLDGRAEIQQYVESTHRYETVVYPEFEY